MEVKTPDVEKFVKEKKGEGEIVILSLNEIKPYKNNAKIHTEAQIAEIRDSIINFGYIDYISVDEDNEILAGHGRLQALYQIDTSGTKRIKVIKITTLNKHEKIAYRIASNKINQLTGFDNIKLGGDFNSLEDTDQFLNTGFTASEISSIWDSKTDITDYSGKNQEVNLSDIESKLIHECPKCHFKFGKK